MRNKQSAWQTYPEVCCRTAEAETTTKWPRPHPRGEVSVTVSVAWSRSLLTRADSPRWGQPAPWQPSLGPSPRSPLRLVCWWALVSGSGRTSWLVENVAAYLQRAGRALIYPLGEGEAGVGKRGFYHQCKGMFYHLSITVLVFCYG